MCSELNTRTAPSDCLVVAVVITLSSASVYHSIRKPSQGAWELWGAGAGPFCSRPHSRTWQRPTHSICSVNDTELIMFIK